MTTPIRFMKWDYKTFTGVRNIPVEDGAHLTPVKKVNCKHSGEKHIYDITDAFVEGSSIMLMCSICWASLKSYMEQHGRTVIEVIGATGLETR